MPASTIANRHARFFDKSLELRARSASPISATTAETGIALPAAKYDAFKVVLDVAAYTSFAAGTAQWAIAVEVATTLGGTYSPVTVSVVPNGTAATYDIPLSGEFADQILSGAAFIRVNATKTGSPGNLTYGAYISTTDA